MQLHSLKLIHGHIDSSQLLLDRPGQVQLAPAVHRRLYKCVLNWISAPWASPCALCGCLPTPNSKSAWCLLHSLQSPGAFAVQDVILVSRLRLLLPTRRFFRGATATPLVSADYSSRSGGASQRMDSGAWRTHSQQEARTQQGPGGAGRTLDFG